MLSALRPAKRHVESQNPALISRVPHGGVAERLNAPVLKTGIGKPIVGSNPTPSASLNTPLSEAGELIICPLRTFLPAPPAALPFPSRQPLFFQNGILATESETGGKE